MFLNIIRRRKGIVLAFFLLLGTVFILYKLFSVNANLPLNFKGSQADLSQSDTTETRLKLGQNIKRAIKGDLSHLFNVSMEQGEYLHLEVEQFSIDLIIVLTHPDGDLIKYFNSPTGMLGTEHIYMEAPTKGDYKIEIRALSKYAEPGKYVIKIGALHTATLVDKKWLAAYKISREAKQLRSKSETRSESIDTYKLAITAWETLGETEQQAMSMRGMGFAVRRLGNDEEALQIFREVLPLWIEVGDVRSEAYTYLIFAAIHKKNHRYGAYLKYKLKGSKRMRKANDMIREMM